MLVVWCVEYGLDIIVLIDGDGDCFLVMDEIGIIILGDILGLIIV